MLVLGNTFIDVLNGHECFMQYSDRSKINIPVEYAFAVIADIESYPEFLPGWISVNIQRREGNKLYVKQDLGFSFLNWTFTTMAILDYPCHINVRTVGENDAQFVLDWNLSSINKRSTSLSVVVTTECLTGPQHRFLHNLLSKAGQSLLKQFTDRISLLYASGQDPNKHETGAY